MAKFCLKLGSIDKKLIMIIISTVLYIIMDLIEYFLKMSSLHIILDSFYSRGISYIMIIIVPLIQKCRKNELILLENNRSCKQITLDLLRVYLMYILYFLAILYLMSLKKKDREDTEDHKMSHYEGLCSEEAIEIIFIIVVSKFLLKMKLYIHHYIGLIIFLILSLGIDLLCNLTIFKPDIFFIFIYILHLIIDSIYITYEKYMMDKLGYSPYIVIFSVGFIFLFGGTVGVIIVYITNNGKVTESFEDYFAKNDYEDVILHIFYLIVFRFFINIFKILTVYYFSPIHTFVSYIIIKMFNLLLNKNAEYKYYSLILFVFQLLGLLIFLEIIELNFWNFDKNTKGNIEGRESVERIKLLTNEEVGDEEKGAIEISPGYDIALEMVGVSKENNYENQS